MERHTGGRGKRMPSLPNTCIQVGVAQPPTRPPNQHHLHVAVGCTRTCSFIQLSGLKLHVYTTRVYGRHCLKSVTKMCSNIASAYTSW